MILCNVQWRVRCVLQFLVQGEDELRQRQALARVSTCVHGDENRWRKARLADSSHLAPLAW